MNWVAQAPAPSTPLAMLGRSPARGSAPRCGRPHGREFDRALTCAAVIVSGRRASNKEFDPPSGRVEHQAVLSKALYCHNKRLWLVKMGANGVYCLDAGTAPNRRRDGGIHAPSRPGGGR